MVRLNSVRLMPHYITLKLGSWYYDAKVVVWALYSYCTEVKWYSKDCSIATVDEKNGYIYAKGVGTTQVYAENLDGSGDRDYITVTVISEK